MTLKKWFAFCLDAENVEFGPAQLTFQIAALPQTASQNTGPVSSPVA